MTDLVWVAVIAAIPPTLTVLVSNHHQNTKAAIIEDKVDQVHALANDRLTKALDKIEALNLTVERLRVDNLGGKK